MLPVRMKRRRKLVKCSTNHNWGIAQYIYKEEGCGHQQGESTTHTQLCKYTLDKIYVYYFNIPRQTQGGSYTESLPKKDVNLCIIRVLVKKLARCVDLEM